MGKRVVGFLEANVIDLAPRQITVAVLSPERSERNNKSRSRGWPASTCSLSWLRRYCPLAPRMKSPRPPGSVGRVRWEGSPARIPSHAVASIARCGGPARWLVSAAGFVAVGNLLQHASRKPGFVRRASRKRTSEVWHSRHKLLINQRPERSERKQDQPPTRLPPPPCSLIVVTSPHLQLARQDMGLTVRPSSLALYRSRSARYRRNRTQ